MAEPTTQPVPETAGQDFVYRPLSGVAVAGVVVASVYAVLLLVYAAAALSRGDPFLLPLWLLLLPAAGVLLSLLGRWHILRSEDTRAGMALTRWGMWIGLVSGLGYATFYFITGLAITTQADNFLRVKGPDAGFLVRLENGDINSAFLLTKTLSERTGFNPSDQEAMEERFDAQVSERVPVGLLTLFTRDPLVRRLAAAGTKAKIEPLGVKSWTFENNGYKVERYYRIDTPEGNFEVLIALQSSNVPGEERKWFVLWQPKQWMAQLVLTPLGEKNKALRHKSQTFANEWFVKIYRREGLSAYLDTQPVSQRQELKNIYALLYHQWFFSPALQEYYLKSLLPGLEDFLSGKGCFDRDHLRAPTPAEQTRTRERLSAFVKDPVQGQFPISIRPEEMVLSTVEETPGGVRVTHQFEFPLPMASGRPGQSFLILGAIVLETADPVADNNLNAQQRWRIVRVDFLRAQPPRPTGPGGPGGPGG